MELQLGLALPTPNMMKIKGFDLNNLGYEQRKEMGGLAAADGCFGVVDKDCAYKNKRGFEQAFTEEYKTMPLLLWSGQPNEEEEDHNDQKKRTSNSINIDE